MLASGNLDHGDAVVGQPQTDVGADRRRKDFFHAALSVFVYPVSTATGVLSVAAGKHQSLFVA